MTASMAPSRGQVFWLRLVSVFLLLISLYLLYGGVQLVALGGSAAYIVIGLLWLVAAALLFVRRSAGAWVYLVSLLLCTGWAAWEAGNVFWQWFPRIMLPVGLGMLVFWTAPFARRNAESGAWARLGRPLGAVCALVLVAMLGLMLVPHGVTEPSAGQLARSEAREGAQPADAPRDWTHYAGSEAGRRYAAISQINADNVGKLELAWSARTGDIATGQYEDQNTPLQIGDTLYVCTPRNRVLALDVDTGEQKWSFDPKGDGPEFLRCRSLGYADLAKNSYAPKRAIFEGVPPSASLPQGACEQRIYLTTADARMMALDASTGKPCEDFGEHGAISLRTGLGDFDPRFYFNNTGPLVIENGLIVVGARVKDNQAVGEPSGVVRGFDVRTGALIWAWDLGNPAITKLPPPGETYTKGTPNVWTSIAADEDLGMVYLPLGNATPDFWGGHRTEADDEYSSAVVALDYVSGKEKWHYQTVHHDLWDYDLPSQPALYDIPDGKGGVTPALIQLTKRGEIFMLDRRTGQPIAEVVEKPVPTHDLPQGERISPTQPYSVGMPAIRHPVLKESDMWGMTMLDQLACRIAFKRARYDGDFTPQSTHPIIQYPGNLGGFNWGSATVDEKHNYLIVNDIRTAIVSWLVPRDPENDPQYFGGLGNYPQFGTPYINRLTNFMSGLGVPCTPPPLGTMTAIDLETREIVWQIPLGTTRDSGPMGIKTHLPVPVGMPTMGAGLATQGDLVFFTGTQDYYVRAMDARTGKEVWKERLSVGGQATPMTYVSPKTGKQYIVFTASGSRGQPDRGDYVMAYALPD
ncbi:quinate dehydrogenase (quinone) [Kerstersia gyiorum]|uniref:membrane-bound PQQ-dependent dehydrogenase, glucose/quinate/shikimate family n=1 Tax=Kerstersia gyiorum TaxID=206506 RepID=UPI0020A1F8A5|nr:membrane-bound PQQ-dependent dehydrogenase, glucose/quinate/shikimate family [Kerstersia gyiorum]MCP1712855.1 quinate dehydrogenase (quinone) [Kerstersia gyiorum]